MKWYKCSIAGENFPGELLSEDKEIGFFTTRFVEADTAEDAEHKALANLKEDESIKLPEGVSPSQKAKVYFEEIIEISKSDVPDVQSGFTFYVMGT
jgi:hypothetical protein